MARKKEIDLDDPEVIAGDDLVEDTPRSHSKFDVAYEEFLAIDDLTPEERRRDPLRR